MNMDWSFSEERDRVVLPKAPARPKRITAGRLGTILGLNAWQSPFYGWCDMTKVYSEPFEGNKYTNAGNVIEPKLIAYAKTLFGEDHVLSPEEYYHTKDAKKSQHYNFFAGIKIFGGMWDAVIVDDEGKIIGVIEIKTSSRPQDWVDGVPDEKLAQGLLYGHLLNVPRTFILASFLEDENYVKPEAFVPDDKNTKLYSFHTETATIDYDGEDCTISDLTNYAEQWYDAYIKTGISPQFDEKKDSEILKELRTQRPDEDENTDLIDIVKAIDDVDAKIEHIREENGLDELEKMRKGLADALKRGLVDNMDEDDTKASLRDWTVSKTVRRSIDSSKLKADGIYDDYVKTSVSYTLKQKKQEK